MIVRGFDMCFNWVQSAVGTSAFNFDSTSKSKIFLYRKILLGTCLTPLLAFMPFSNAFAGCAPVGQVVQTCSGSDTTPVIIDLSGVADITIATEPGYSINANDPNYNAAFRLRGAGKVELIDEHKSVFTNSSLADGPYRRAVQINAWSAAGDVAALLSSNGELNGMITVGAYTQNGNAQGRILLDQQTGRHSIDSYVDGGHGSASLEISATGDIYAPDESYTSGIDVGVASSRETTLRIAAQNVRSGANGYIGIGAWVSSASDANSTNNQVDITVSGKLQAARGFGLWLDGYASSSLGEARSDIRVNLHDVTSQNHAIVIDNSVYAYDTDGSFLAEMPLSSVALTITGSVSSQDGSGVELESFHSDQMLTISGAVTGGNGRAISLFREGSWTSAGQPLSEQDGMRTSSTLELRPGYRLNGSTTVTAEGWVPGEADGEEIMPGNYFVLSNGRLVLGGSGQAEFDLSRIDNRGNALVEGAADRISGFGTLSVTGDAQWSMIGSNDRDANDAFLYSNIDSGVLTLDNAHLALRATMPDLVPVTMPDEEEMPELLLLDEAETPSVATDLTFVAEIPDGASAGALTISNAGTLAVNGASSVMGNIINSGLILLNPCATCAGNVLTVTGNYQGNNGVVSIGTVLGDDTSKTDKLVIEGNSSGTSIVKVTNEKGVGALTREGIEIITIGGDSSGTFTLQNGYVVAGAYTYRLYKGNASGSDAKDWYLRSALTPVDPVDPVDPQPEYHVGSPVYESYAQSLLGMNGVATLQQRVGNRVWAGNGNRMIAEGADAVQPEAAAVEAGQVVEGNGVWGRVEGTHSRIEPKFSTADTDYNQNVFKLQAGIDGKLSESETGTLIGGVFVHYVHGKTKTSSTNYADGEIASDGYGFGGTLTWYGDKGFYVDAQAQATWYSSDLTTSALAAPVLKDGNDGFGYALSLEAGQRFAVNEAWSLTPQAQLIYSRVDFDTFTDGFGSSVGLDKGDSLQGRLGLTLDHASAWQNANGGMDRANVYGIVNLYSEFLDGTRVDLAGVSLASKKDRSWGGIGAGGSYNWDNDKYSIYGEGLINTSLNNLGDSYSVKGNAGFRVKW